MLKAKTLYLVRHAKSSWNDASLSDRERPLSKRGISNVPLMAARLAELIKQEDGEFPAPQRVISSPARRAMSTAKRICTALGFSSTSIDIEERLYFRGPGAMMDIITEQPSDVDAIMLIGHNPDLTDLHNQLNPVETDNLPTCAIVTLHFECESWEHVTQKKGCMVNYDYPKKQLKID